MRSIRIFALIVVASVLSACGGGGGGGGTTPPPVQNPPPPPPVNTAPQIRVLATGDVQASAAADISATVGGEVRLDASGTTDPEADALTYEWSLLTKPAASTLTFPSATTTIISFRPDVLGTFEFRLRVTDSKTAFAERTVTVLTDNSPPTPSVAVSATFSATPTTAPTQQISVGSAVVIDATGSTDPNGDVLTRTFTLTAAPPGSGTTLVTNANSARFTANAQGIYRVTVRGQDPLGAYFESIYVFEAQNRAPTAVVLAQVTPVTSNSGSNTVQATAGYNVSLTGSVTDPDNDSLTRAWLMTSRPAGSTAELSSASAASTQFVPDVLGAYVVRLTAVDPSGASTIYTTTVQVNNRRPIANIGTNATPVALPSAPSIRVPVNTQLTLRATGSSDADGDTLTYAWSIVSKPSGSAATIVNANLSIAQYTPDFAGNYVLRLRVTDSAGAYSERTLGIDIGNYPPVAVIDKNRTTVLSGRSLTASGILSYDEDASPLSYTWSVDARPAGSTASIASPNNSILSFTPDRPGVYVIALTVNDGTASNVAYLNVRALSTIAGSVTLPFVPLDSKYSRGLDKVVMIGANPNALYIVDPFIGSIRSVPLPAAHRSLSISPDGTLAAVLHESLATLVDLQTAQAVRTSMTEGLQTEIFMLNDGFAYLIGQSGGQWVDRPITLLDMRTGTVGVPPVGTCGGNGGFAYFYGTQKGVFANLKNRVLFMAYGLSPSDISFFDVNQTTHSVNGSGDSPYHGDYPLGQDFYLSGNQDLLFTSYGNFFNTETLRFAGSLGIVGMISMSHSSTADEALVLQTMAGNTYPYTGVYSDVYKRFTSALFIADGDLPFPLVGGQQTYGLKIFHSSADNHVALVQAGSADPLATGLTYHVIYR
jgi:K319L-like, PKD domain